MKRFLKHIGPGPLVAAAFIGPGTVTVCTLAGVGFGYKLLWTMVLSTIATIILQEMTVRLGLVTKKGLSEVIRQEIQSPIFKTIAIILILSAIVIGNAAYEGGNISGGVLGLQAIFGIWELNIYNLTINGFSLLVGLIAFIVLYFGNYKILERCLVALVILMSLAFIVTAILTKPNLHELLKGAFIPNFPQGSILLLIALIGTTVVPYNLFLHAALVKEKWQSTNDIGHARLDTYVAIGLGGLVSMCIIIAASAIKVNGVNNAADLALALEPLFGRFAKYIMAIGLFAAGITSAITAPLAAAYVAAGCFGWPTHFKAKKFRYIWFGVLLTGVILSSSGIRPIEIIKFAQVANGILLPVISGLLLWIMNRNVLLGTYKNSMLQNIMGMVILILCFVLALTALQKVFGLNIL